MVTVFIIDNKIPYIKGVFEQSYLYQRGELAIYYRDSSEFDNCIHEAYETYRKDCSIVLIIRTRTKANATLLRGYNVRIIATATIGTDHIDLDYCNANGIKVFSAPGCNSGGVMQYVFTALYYLKQNSRKKSIEQLLSRLPINELQVKNNSDPLTIGIIGCGNVGSKVERFAKRIGMKVLLNDPPKQLIDNSFCSCSIDELLSSSDIVTIHTPLNSTTYNMVNSSFLSKMKEGAILINSSRGEVVDEAALLSAEHLGGYILDVWRNEPNISKELLNKSLLATPHIAGYSIEGKINGTQMVVDAICNELKIAELQNYKVASQSNLKPISFEQDIASELTTLFPIGEIDRYIRNNPSEFERFRGEYQLRHEFIY